MSGLNQNDLEHLKDMIQLGNMTADQANVEMVRMARVKVVRTRLPFDVRSALNGAVKNGYLGHKKKDGRKPEVYYHPDFEYLANSERNRVEKEVLDALVEVLSRPELSQEEQV